MPKVSVIVPCYNVEEHLVNCFQDLSNQTLKDVEFLLVNDGSNDKSLEKIQAFSKIDSRVTLISSQNRGVSSARNTGIRLARAPYLFFFDPDDRIDNDYLEKLYFKIRSGNFDVVKSNYFRVDRLGRKSKTSLNEILEKSQNSLLGLNSDWQGCLYSKQLIKEYNIEFPEHITYKEDVAFLFCFTAVARKLGFENSTNYYYYFQRPGSSTNFLLNNRKKTISKLYHSILQLVFRINFLNNLEGNTLDEYKYNLLFYKTIKTCFNYLKNPLFEEDDSLKGVVGTFFSSLPTNCANWEKLKISFPDQIYNTIERYSST